jgi:hypothetical protein
MAVMRFSCHFKRKRSVISDEVLSYCLILLKEPLLDITAAYEYGDFIKFNILA